VAVPNILIVYREKEKRDIVAEAGKIAFYLGTRVEDTGFSCTGFLEKRYAPNSCKREKHA
jgi:hypothetical protein